MTQHTAKERITFAAGPSSDPRKGLAAKMVFFWWCTVPFSNDEMGLCSVIFIEKNQVGNR